MAKQPYIVPLTEVLWDDLRRKMQTFPGTPLWISEVCAKPFSEVSVWPAELRADGITKPELWCSNRASCLSFDESQKSIRPRGKEAENHQRKMTALRMALPFWIELPQPIISPSILIKPSR